MILIRHNVIQAFNAVPRKRFHSHFADSLASRQSQLRHPFAFDMARDFSVKAELAVELGIVLGVRGVCRVVRPTRVLILFRSHVVTDPVGLASC